jgi:hypothetical protein
VIWPRERSYKGRRKALPFRDGKPSKGEYYYGYISKGTPPIREGTPSIRD